MTDRQKPAQNARVLCKKIICDSFGEQIKRNINTQYLYGAGGRKLKTEYTAFAQKSQLEIKRITKYFDNFQYENGVLQFSANQEGYYDFKNKRYIYNYTDHLGNIRLSYFKNAGGSAEVLEENNYYPFGLKHEGYNATVGNPSYQYKYNGKELQETGMLDYGWRQYMPEIGRWNGIDQLAEMYVSTSTYSYVMNKPISFIDPDGRYVSQIQDLKNSLPNIYSGWEYVNGVKLGDWSRYPQQFSSMISHLSSGESGGGGGLISTGQSINWKLSGFSYITHWTGGSTGPGYMDIGTAHWKSISDGFMEFTDTVDSYAKEINNFPAKDFPAFLDTHFNGGLGYAEMAVKSYDKIPNSFKRKIAYKLSKMTPWKAGEVFQKTKGFMNRTGKITGKLGRGSTALSLVAAGVDVFDDGHVKTSTIANGVLLGVGLAFPATAPFILAYGVLDYTFDFGGKIDNKFGEFNTHLYD